MRFDLDGDWGELREIIANFRNTAHFKKALQRAIQEEAYNYQRAVIEGIDSGAPAGKTFAPHSPMTIALRIGGGTKVLVHTAALRNSVTVQKQGGLTYLVGVHRQAPGGVNLAAVHEFGATIRITDKMRRYLHARMREAGLSGGGGGGGGSGVITIPARPYMGPVYEQMYGNTAEAKARFMRRVAELLNYQLGDGEGGSGGGGGRGRSRRSRGSGGSKAMRGLSRFGKSVAKHGKKIGKSLARSGKKLSKSAVKTGKSVKKSVRRGGKTFVKNTRSWLKGLFKSRKGRNQYTGPSASSQSDTTSSSAPKARNSKGRFVKK